MNIEIDAADKYYGSYKRHRFISFVGKYSFMLLFYSIDDISCDDLGREGTKNSYLSQNE